MGDDTLDGGIGNDTLDGGLTTTRFWAVTVTDFDEVEYFHFLFDRHEVVYSNGAETESLYTGPEALKSISAEARAEIFALFPELQAKAPPPPARMLPKGRFGRQLARRHQKNGVALQVSFSGQSKTQTHSG